ncbi:hypothetical protein LY76DRAFT_593783, partial [Colletotrichum caudatum]
MDRAQPHLLSWRFAASGSCAQGEVRRQKQRGHKVDLTNGDDDAVPVNHPRNNKSRQVTTMEKTSGKRSTEEGQTHTMHLLVCTYCSI